MDRPLALITGASSGIGRAMARELAASGFDVALSARDAAALETTAGECRARGASALILAADLSVPGAAARLAAKISRPVEALVNNAGFGLYGNFAETSMEREREMLAVHVEALLELTRLFLPGMIKRKHGRILNVASVYAFAPVPGQALYAATKAFMACFTHSLSGELKGTGVTATVVYPGITRTPFRARAGMRTHAPRAGMTPEAVAKAAVRGMLAGRRAVIPGFSNKAFVLLTRLVGGPRLPGLMRLLNRLRGLRPA